MELVYFNWLLPSVVESRKQSTSTIRLANKSDKDVAFKVNGVFSSTKD